jgi:hypothetical protein
MSNDLSSTRPRRRLMICGLALLAGLAAGSAQAQLDPETYENYGRDRVKQASDAVEEAQNALHDAQQAARDAETALANEMQRLAQPDQADAAGQIDPTELVRLQGELAEANEAVLAAQVQLLKARKTLLDRLKRKVGQLERKLRRQSDPDKKDELQNEIDRLQNEIEALQHQIDELQNEIENALGERVDAVGRSHESDAKKREELRDLTHDIERAGLDADAEERLLDKLNQGEDDGSSLPGAPGEESLVAAVAAPAGSRVILTGTVVAGEQATLTAVGPDGAVLSGVVVEVGGERRVTDGQGRVLFRVAAAAGGVLAVALPGLGGGGTAAARVLPALADGASAAVPEIATAPRFATPGSALHLDGSGFRGDAAGDAVALGDSKLPVLAASPTEIVAATPSDLAPGATSLTVETAAGRSAAVPVTGIRIGLRGGPAHLRSGETARVQVLAEGTAESVPLVVTNLSSNVRLAGGPTTTVTTRGGRDNAAEIVLTGVTPGPFRLSAEVADETAASAPDADELRRLEEKASEASGRGHDLEADGKPEEAAEAFEKAAEAFEKAGRTAQADAEHTNAGASYSEAADAAAEAGDTAEADRLYERAAEQYEKAGRTAQAAAERAHISGG